MKNEFVKTKNVKHFLTGIANLSTRGAQEACLMIVDGQPGLGKTSTVNWWVMSAFICEQKKNGHRNG